MGERIQEAEAYIRDWEAKERANGLLDVKFTINPDAEGGYEQGIVELAAIIRDYEAGNCEPVEFDLPTPPKETLT